MPKVHNFGSLSYKFDTEIPTIVDHGPYLFFKGGDCDETDLMLEYWKIKDGDIVIDAGAHIGSWTLPALSLGAQKVYAFEPNYECTTVLRQNLTLNDWLDKVEIIDKALWHKKERNMYHEYAFPQMLPPNQMFRTVEGSDYEVDCIPLDSMNFDRIDWMKIDVDGSEIAVLVGAKNTILTHKPKMIIEVHPGLIKKVIPEFTLDMIKNWLPPSEIKNIGGRGAEDTPRILVLPT